MVLTRSGRKRLETAKESVSNTDSTFSLKRHRVCVTDSTCSSKMSRLSRANLSMSELSPVNAPVKWNITKSYMACVDDVLELGFDGHQMSFAIAKFIKSEAWQYFFATISREERIDWIRKLS
ncbi:hypothetical protein LguiA_016900 [Lonicera macranthoides]